MCLLYYSVLGDTIRRQEQMSATAVREPTTDSRQNTGKVSLGNQFNLIGITYRSTGELLLTGAKMCSKTHQKLSP